MEPPPAAPAASPEWEVCSSGPGSVPPPPKGTGPCPNSSVTVGCKTFVYPHVTVSRPSATVRCSHSASTFFTLGVYQRVSPSRHSAAHSRSFIPFPLDTDHSLRLDAHLGEGKCLLSLLGTTKQDFCFILTAIPLLVLTAYSALPLLLHRQLHNRKSPSFGLVRGGGAGRHALPWSAEQQTPPPSSAPSPSQPASVSSCCD